MAKAGGFQEENDTDQAAYNAAEATMNADKANVARLMALEAFKNVTAPFDGRVTARLIDIGTLVSAGSGSAGTTLVPDRSNESPEHLR